MIRLASQPMMPPTISQMMIPAMSASFLFSRPGTDARPVRHRRRAMRRGCSGNGRTCLVSQLTRTLGGERSVALLALVLVAVLLDARDAEAGHAAAVDRALPAGEFR